MVKLVPGRQSRAVVGCEADPTAGRVIIKGWGPDLEIRSGTREIFSTAAGWGRSKGDRDEA